MIYVDLICCLIARFDLWVIGCVRYDFDVGIACNNVNPVLIARRIFAFSLLDWAALINEYICSLWKQ